MVQVVDGEVVVHARDNHCPVQVNAQLQDGVIAETDYILDLAGILHSRCRLIGGRPVDDPSTIDDPTVYDLPLARCGFGSQWMWSASSAVFHSAESRFDSRTFYRRDDPAWGAAHSRRPIPYAVHPTRGPWRDVMMPAPAAVVHHVSWRCIGDAPEIARLLKTVRHIGKRRHSGEGRVLAWSVTPCGDIEDWVRWPFIDGDRIIRPCPPELAENVPHITGWHSARPPAWNAGTMAELAMTAPQEF